MGRERCCAEGPHDVPLPLRRHASPRERHMEFWGMLVACKGIESVGHEPLRCSRR